MTPVILSYGLGVDSTAILVRWLENPTTRDFDLRDLTVVTAMTGDEWAHTKHDVERFVLPLLRQHKVRFVQVARRQRYVRGLQDVAVLSDTRSPTQLRLDGDYRLSDEMLEAGTIPQSGGARLCSVHAKGDVLDPIIAQVTGGEPYRHVVGFELNEPRRAVKDQKFDTALRTGIYPLRGWGWDRQACLDYLERRFGVIWHKSACVYCPFSLNNTVSRRRQFELYREHPEAGAAALFMEHVALALNPNQGLVAGKRLFDLIGAEEGMEGVFYAFERKLNVTQHAIYEVRRIIRPRLDDPTKMANAARSVRKVARGRRRDMQNQLVDHMPAGQFWIDPPAHRFYLHQRGDTLPTTEHFYVVAPAVALDKQDDNFEKWWLDATATRKEVA